MAKRAKKALKRKNLPLWKWAIMLLPLIVAFVWFILLFFLNEQIPLLDEQASPGGVSVLLWIILLFIVSYGVFAFMTFRKLTSEQ